MEKSFNTKDVENDFLELQNLLNDSENELVSTLKNLYFSIKLAKKIPEGMTFSKMMIEKYEKHKRQLLLLKKYINSVDGLDQAEKLRLLYSDYIHRVGKKKNNLRKSIDQTKFTTEVKKFFLEVKPTPISDKILEEINAGDFMPKQRTWQNITIPYQVQLLELDKIINNQGKYYKWLKDINPNKELFDKGVTFKIGALVAFKIPYYVGPLVEKIKNDKNKKNMKNAKFSWMTRAKNNKGKITPWNFNEKINKSRTASDFIQRMTSTDQYLIGEDVLPASSLIYQKFEVLNELNKIRINRQPLTLEEKQQIFAGLFKKYKTVSTKKLREYLVCKMGYSDDEELKIEGLANPKQFNSNLNTYIDFRNIFGDKIDKDGKQKDFEKIIKWSTIFKDREIFFDELKKLGWLNEEEIHDLITLKNSSWGKLSNKLLTELKDQQHMSIMDYLWRSNKNFMQIYSENGFEKLVNDINSGKLENKKDVWEKIDELPTSQKNKKAIRKVIFVVRDICKAMNGNIPEYIDIEFAKDQRPIRNTARPKLDNIENLYKNVSDEFLRDDVTKAFKNFSNEQLTDMFYLYFKQGGWDVYSQEPLSVADFNKYHIDHIIPRAYYKDNSLDNRVLTTSKNNELKGKKFPLKSFGNKLIPWWKRLESQGLLSRYQLVNLMTEPDSMSQYRQDHFIKGQLVETRQITKNVAEILSQEFNGKAKIITVKANLTHQFREEFRLIKNRNVNDFHHAFDAYITAFIGNHLITQYPKLERYFVYGEFKRISKEFLKNLRTFDFLNQLKENSQQGTLIVDKQIDDYVRKVYRFKKVTVVREVYIKNGALYRQTINPVALANKSKLIPIKNSKPVNIYGGYSGSNCAMMSIIQIHGKKEYRVIKIPTAWIYQLQQASKNSKDENLILHRAIDEQLMIKFGKILQYKIVVGRVLHNQLVLNKTDKGLFMLDSNINLFNAKELVLSENAMKILDPKYCSLKKFSADVENEKLNTVYAEILSLVDDYFPILDINKFREKLHKSKEKFAKLPILDDKNKKGKRTVITSILQGIRKSSSSVTIPELGITQPRFGQLFKTSGITLTGTDQLIYQSAAGLYERKIKLDDLK